jgi:hypothetical protein
MNSRGIAYLSFSIFAVICVGACTQSSNLSEQGTAGGSIETLRFDSDDTDTQEAAGDSVCEITLNGDSVTVVGSGAAAKGTVVTISAAGTYRVSGSLTDGQLRIEAGDEDKVAIVLAGASIAHATSSPIYIVNAGKTILTLAEGTENSVSDGAGYVLEDAAAAEPDAAIFSSDDLSINGTGSLFVDANFRHGIKSKDGLKIASGVIAVDAVGDGIKGRDYVAIKGGTIAIKAGQDGIQSYNDEDSGKGYVLIEGGTFDIDSTAKGLKAISAISISLGSFDISSNDDSIHCDEGGDISGGTFALSSGGQGIKFGDSSSFTIGGDATVIVIAKSTEGIAGYHLTIDGGKISIAASDDGFSMSAGTVAGGTESNDGSLLTINGGYITIDSLKDGVDSNGSATMTGGTLIVNGPVSSPEVAIDVNGTFAVRGGLIVAAANYNNMTMALGSSSAQCSILAKLTSSQAAGTLFHIQDSSGTDILTFAPTKSYQSIIFSSPDLKTGSSYSAYCGGSSTGSAIDGLYSGGIYSAGTLFLSFTPASSVTTLGSVSSGGGAPGGGGTVPGGNRP